MLERVPLIVVTVAKVAADQEFKLLNTIPMGDADDNDNRACIAVSQGNLFLRTGSKLYCVGK